MFSMLPSHTHTYAQSNPYHTPHKPSPLSSSPLRNTTPSPLSPRDINVQSARTQQQQDAIMSSPSKRSGSSPPSHFDFSNSNSIFTTPPEHSTKHQNQNATSLISPPPSKRESAYSKRTTKPNPLMSGRGSGDEGRETRRKLFLKKVREESEEKRWAARGGDEEIMRCLWVAEERRRVERQRREAMGIEAPMGEEEDEAAQAMSLDEVMAEEVAMSEEQELEAMLGSMSPEESAFNYGSANSNQMGMLFEEMETGNRKSNATPADQQSIYGSDDDDYDQLFMDVIEQESRMSSQYQPPGYVQDHDMMDMS
ncbi:hypothetical protein BKA64DRAFT_429243 [Cadophora sp. MPI-SDFR-AT-0126]|nr:hypothetical protein BKA64DRAFT_429243 [Leotiomycetes sp. MPI-SDFR-AT-0126]